MDVDDALNDIRFIKEVMSRARSQFFFGGAEFLLIWGVVWLVGYLMPIAGAPPNWIGPAWLVLDGVGAVASLWMGFRLGRQFGPATYLLRKWMWTGLVALLLSMVAASLGDHSYLAGSGMIFVWPIAAGFWYMFGGLLAESKGMLILGSWIALVSSVAPFLPLSMAMRSAVIAAFAATSMIGAYLYGLRQR